jgi:hypothetical protein
MSRSYSSSPPSASVACSGTALAFNSEYVGSTFLQNCGMPSEEYYNNPEVSLNSHAIKASYPTGMLFILLEVTSDFVIKKGNSL